MSAYVLLNLLKKLRKRDKIKCEACYNFNKFSITGAQMLDSIYHMTLKLLKNHIFGAENIKVLPYFLKHYYVKLLKL